MNDTRYPANYYHKMLENLIRQAAATTTISVLGLKQQAKKTDAHMLRNARRLLYAPTKTRSSLYKQVQHNERVLRTIWLRCGRAYLQPKPIHPTYCMHDEEPLGPVYCQTDYKRFIFAGISVAMYKIVRTRMCQSASANVRRVLRCH